MANAIRALAMDAVEAAKSGHPGMPMGMADVATVLLARFLEMRDAPVIERLKLESLLLDSEPGAALIRRELDLGGGLTLDHRGTEHEVGHHGRGRVGARARRRVVVGEGEHVRRVVLAAPVAVELPAFVGVDDAHGDLRRPLERGAHPARDTVARQLVVYHRRPGGQSQFSPLLDLQRGFRRAYGARVKFNPNLEAIGYHCVIDTSGFIGAGRDLGEIGAHAKGHNARSIGICCVGTDAYTLPQWSSLAHLVASLSRKFPAARVVGHRDLSPDLDGDGTVEPREWTKTCPGFDVATWLEGGMAPLAGHLLETV